MNGFSYASFLNYIKCCNRVLSYHTLIGKQCHQYRPNTFGSQSVELRKIDVLVQMVVCRDEFVSIRKVDSRNAKNRLNFFKLTKTRIVNIDSPEFLVSIYCCTGSSRSNQLQRNRQHLPVNKSIYVNKLLVLRP